MTLDKNKKLSPAEIQAIIKDADADGSGTIGW